MIWVDAAYADHMLHCMSSWVSSRQCPSRSKLKRSLPHSDWQTLEVSKSYLWKNRLHQNLMVNLMVKNIILYFKYPWITFPSIYFPIAIHWGLASPWILDKFTSSVGFPHCESTQNGESIGNNIYIYTYIHILFDLFMAGAAKSFRVPLGTTGQYRDLQGDRHWGVRGQGSWNWVRVGPYTFYSFQVELIGLGNCRKDRHI